MWPYLSIPVESDWSSPYAANICSVNWNFIKSRNCFIKQIKHVMTYKAKCKHNENNVTWSVGNVVFKSARKRFYCSLPISLFSQCDLFCLADSLQWQKERLGRTKTTTLKTNLVPQILKLIYHGVAPCDTWSQPWYIPCQTENPLLPGVTKLISIIFYGDINWTKLLVLLK